jgi:hypothetical protein
MRTLNRLSHAALLASYVLILLTSGSLAQRLEASNGSIRATFPALRFFGTEPFGGTVEVICPVTLEGTFHSKTISKEPERLVGYVTRAITNQNVCTENGLSGVTILQERLPWHIRYESFAGTLPEITRVIIRLALIAFRVRAVLFNIECLYQSTAAQPVRGFVERNIATGQAMNLIALAETSVPRFEGPTGSCPTSGRYQGSAGIRVLGSATSLIFIRLI